MFVCFYKILTLQCRKKHCRSTGKRLFPFDTFGPVIIVWFGYQEKAKNRWPSRSLTIFVVVWPYGWNGQRQCLSGRCEMKRNFSLMLLLLLFLMRSCKNFNETFFRRCSKSTDYTYRHNVLLFILTF